MIGLKTTSEIDFDLFEDRESINKSVNFSTMFFLLITVLTAHVFSTDGANPILQCH